MPMWGTLWLIVVSLLLIIHIFMDMREIGKLKDELEALKKLVAFESLGSDQATQILYKNQPSKTRNFGPRDPLF